MGTMAGPWTGWLLLRSLEPIKAFARKLKGYLPGILAHCRWQLHTSLIEGINNKIKVIKRMAYGFRDDDLLLPQDPCSVPRNCRMNLFYGSLNWRSRCRRETRWERPLSGEAGA